MTDILLADTIGAVRVLTLHRPDRLNALTPELMDALNAAFDAAADDTRVRTILLTGAGRGFCAGADLAQDRLTSNCRTSVLQIDRSYNPLSAACAPCPNPSSARSTASPPGRA